MFWLYPARKSNIWLQYWLVMTDQFEFCEILLWCTTLSYQVYVYLNIKRAKILSAKIQIGTLCRSPFVSGAFLQWWRWKWRRSTLRNRRWQNWAFTAYQVCSNAVKKGPPRKELKKSSCWKKTRKFLCMTVNEKVAL